jgi:hypothetical protein
VPIHRVLDVPEVVEVLRNNDVPLLVPDHVITELMERQGEGLFDRMPAVLEVGQSVKLLGGAFAGHVARIKSLLSEEAARVVVTPTSAVVVVAATVAKNNRFCERRSRQWRHHREPPCCQTARCCPAPSRIAAALGQAVRKLTAALSEVVASETPKRWSRW